METVNVPVKRLDETLDMPAYAYLGDAGLDLRAAESLVLKPFQRAMVLCGIAVAIPEGHAGLVFARSGLASKQGLAPSNKVGVIDSDYRGEIMVSLYNHSDTPRMVNHGDRIAQIVIMPYIKADWAVCEELGNTERGSGGFGSTGINVIETLG